LGSLLSFLTQTIRQIKKLEGFLQVSTLHKQCLWRDSEGFPSCLGPKPPKVLKSFSFLVSFYRWQFSTVRSAFRQGPLHKLQARGCHETSSNILFCKIRPNQIKVNTVSPINKRICYNQSINHMC
jgi:hypothetical protein